VLKDNGSKSKRVVDISTTRLISIRVALSPSSFSIHLVVSISVMDLPEGSPSRNFSSHAIPALIISLSTSVLCSSGASGANKMHAACCMSKRRFADNDDIGSEAIERRQAESFSFLATTRSGLSSSITTVTYGDKILRDSFGCSRTTSCVEGSIFSSGVNPVAVSIAGYIIHRKISVNDMTVEPGNKCVFPGSVASFLDAPIMTISRTLVILFSDGERMLTVSGADFDRF